MTRSASSRRVATPAKNATSTGATRTPRPRRRGTDWERLATQTDADIAAAVANDPDAAPVADAFWDRTPVVRGPNERSVVVALDADVVRWLSKKKDGKARLNAALREQM